MDNPLLIKLVVILFAITAFLVSFPACWPWYLRLLDARIWPPWKCIGVGVALMESLVVIHLWPTKKRSRPTKGTGGKTRP